MNVDDLLNGRFSSDEFIEMTNKIFDENLGNAFITTRLILKRLSHMRSGIDGRFLIQGNKLLGCKIVIVKEPCFILGVIELD